MVKRQMWVRKFACGMAAIAMVSNVGAVTAYAAENDDMAITGYVDESVPEEAQQEEAQNEEIQNEEAQQVEAQQADDQNTVEKETVDLYMLLANTLCKDKASEENKEQVKTSEGEVKTDESKAEENKEETPVHKADAGVLSIMEFSNSRYVYYDDGTCSEIKINDDKSETLVENKPYTKEDYCKAYLGYNFLNYIALGREKSDEIRKMDKQQLMEFIEECNKKPYYDVNELYHKYIPNYGGEYKSEFFELAIKSANEGVMQTNGQAAANLVGDVEPIKYAENSIKNIITGLAGQNVVVPDSVYSNDFVEINNMEDEPITKNNDYVDSIILRNQDNNFINFAKDGMSRAKSIAEIRQDKNLSDIQKTIKVAELIGSTKEWDEGEGNATILKNMAAASQALIANENGDNSTKTMYEAIYNFNKHDCLFSGEVLTKSKGFIETRVSSFVRNCEIVMECLRAHNQVAKLTEEQVKTLDPETKAVYDRIHGDSATVFSKIKTVAEIFLGSDNADGTHNAGVADTAREYGKKDRCTYINYGKNGDGIKLNKQLSSKEANDYTIGKFTDINALNEKVNNSPLTTDDLNNIFERASKQGKTVKNYLSEVGFDTSNMSNGVILTGSYDDRPEYVNAGITISVGRGTMGAKGVGVDDTSCKEQKVKITEHEHRVFWTCDTRLENKLPIFTFEAK